MAKHLILCYFKPIRPVLRAGGGSAAGRGGERRWPPRHSTLATLHCRGGAPTSPTFFWDRGWESWDSLVLVALVKLARTAAAARRLRVCERVWLRARVFGDS